jgi:hypothetical protein
MGQNRTQTTAGTYKTLYENPKRFKEWKVYINETGMVLIKFTGEKRATIWHTNPFNPNLTKELTFDNPKDWAVYKEQCDTAFENQQKRFPAQFIKQQRDAELDMNLFKKRNIVPMSQELETV